MSDLYDKLYYYQKDTADKFKQWYVASEVDREALINYATGLGKTETAIACLQMVRDLKPGARILWLTHRTELVVQSKARIDKNSEANIQTAVEQGTNYSDPSAGVIVASIPSLKGKRLKKFKKANPHFDLIVFDEAHHSTAPTWGFVKTTYPESRILNLTATPFRADTEEQLRLGEVLASLSVEDGQKMGFLVDIEHVGSLEVDLDDVGSSKGDYKQGPLGSRMLEPRYLGSAYQKLVEHGKGKKTLVFAANVAHGKRLAEMLSSGGFKVGQIYEDTSQEERQEYIQGLKTGKYDMIVNNVILTEGVDIPEVDFVANFRPTESAVLFLQMLGRGLRKFPGKTKCLFLDAVDRRKRYVKKSGVVFPTETQVIRNSVITGKPQNTLTTFLGWFKPAESGRPPLTPAHVMDMLTQYRGGANGYEGECMQTIHKAMTEKGNELELTVQPFFKALDVRHPEAFLRLMANQRYYYCPEYKMPKSKEEIEKMLAEQEDLRHSSEQKDIPRFEEKLVKGKLSNFITDIPDITLANVFKNTYKVFDTFGKNRAWNRQIVDGKPTGSHFIADRDNLFVRDAKGDIKQYQVEGAYGNARVLGLVAEGEGTAVGLRNLQYGGKVNRAACSPKQKETIARQYNCTIQDIEVQAVNGSAGSSLISNKAMQQVFKQLQYLKTQGKDPVKTTPVVTPVYTNRPGAVVGMQAAAPVQNKPNSGPTGATTPVQGAFNFGPAVKGSLPANTLQKTVNVTPRPHGIFTEYYKGVGLGEWKFDRGAKKWLNHRTQEYMDSLIVVKNTKGTYFLDKEGSKHTAVGWDEVNALRAKNEPDR